jgi:uncharacterized repeat protein (TIGR04138 family)
MAIFQLLDRIRSELIDTKRDTRYHIGSYEFVLNGMEFYITTIGEKRHISGQELSKGLLMFAQKQFGPLARTVLLYWGIESTEDFGNIVYNMIDIGIMSKQAEDSIEHFHNVIDVDLYFSDNNSFKIDKEMIKKIKGA